VTPDQVAARLVDLPPATLVLGPGAWPLVARSAAPHWMMHEVTSAEEARKIRAAAYILPSAHGTRVIAVNMGGASAQVQNMLLKVLEEPPSSTRFVLAAEERPLPTVVSRCRVLVLGSQGDRQAPDGRDMAAVGTALKAVLSGQTALLAQTVRAWLPVHAALLTQWAAEAASGCWRDFGPDFAPGVSPDRALRLLAELRAREGTRLGPLVALDRVFAGE
jgi:hypothetical protein